jgi:hypothetical protein
MLEPMLAISPVTLGGGAEAERLHEDHGGDADDDAEGGEQRAHLVAQEGAEGEGEGVA